jgi:hypothetical protein
MQMIILLCDDTSMIINRSSNLSFHKFKFIDMAKIISLNTDNRKKIIRVNFEMKFMEELDERRDIGSGEEG